MSEGGAWVRKDRNWYGEGLFPFGACAFCERAACHHHPDGKQLVCQRHLPPEIFFAPFLGQQEKLYNATERYVLGGGGAGGAKTHAGSRLYLKQWWHEQQRHEKAKREGREFQSVGWSIFFRRTMPELLQVIESFKRYFQLVDKGARWDAQNKLCVWSNGFKTQFGGMENEDDYLKYYSNQYSLVVFDEGTQFSWTQIENLDSRIRCSDPVLDRLCQLYVLTNPVGGETKAKLKRDYVDVAPPETRIPIKVTLADGRVKTRHKIYIPCNLLDNPSLTETGTYEANLRTKGEAMMRALLMNDWTVDEGSWVGSDWNPERHVIKPHAIPGTWVKFKCGDYGYSSKTAIHWCAVDHDGGVVVYRSMSCRGLLAEQVSELIREHERLPLEYLDRTTGKRIVITGPEWNEAMDSSDVYGVMDAACWARTGESGVTRGETFQNMGTGFSPSDKGTTVRHNAADQIRKRLRMKLADSKGSTEPGIAGLRFFHTTTETPMVDSQGRRYMTGPIHTIPLLAFDIKDPEVWDTTGDDHDMDALAYGIQSRPFNQELDPAETMDFFSIRAPRGAAAGKGQKIAW